MNATLFRDRLLASTIIFSGALLIGAPAFAQTPAAGNAPAMGPAVETGAPATTRVAAADAADAALEDDSTIVVTGSLIKNPNLVQSSPVAVVGQEELQLRQTNVAEEVLRTIPGIVPSIGSAVNNGNGGASFVNLRGIGVQRNLVLLDGVRLVPAGTGGAVDLNNIPLAMLDRLDILTGGASTTYGADAVGGVVNFITKKDFAGVELNASEQISEEGDGNTWRADLTVGANFDDGRGNATFSIGYQKAKPVYQGDRDFGAFNISSFTGASGGSGTTVPSRINAIPGLGSRQIDPVTGALLTAAQSPGGAFIPFNFNPFNIYATPFERFNMFGQASYKIVNDVEAYAQGVFSKNRVTTIIAPSGTFGNALVIPLSNPFLPAAARNQICTAQGLTAAQCAAAATAGPNSPDYRTFTSSVGRRFVEAGTRDNTYTTTFFQYKAGLRGPITDNIEFDVFGAYGESENLSRQTGNGLLTRLRQATLATGAGCNDTSNGCVPINLFGAAGSITPAQLAFVTGVSSSSTTFSNLGQARALLSGDLGFSSPGAENPISFALGAEYRNYTAGSSSDLATATPGEVLGNGGANPDIVGSYNVKELFAEINAPLIEDAPFFKSLTLELGGRYSDYSSSGTNYTWKAGGSWEPIQGVKFRGNYQKAVRAPNVGELFNPLVTGLDNLNDDPCSFEVPAGRTRATPATNPQLRALCIAQGATAGNVLSIVQPSAGQNNITSGGNPSLGVEVARTYTFGVVVAPAVVPGLSLTVDYYRIKVTDAVSSSTTQDVIDACFGSGNPTFNATPFCTANIRRNPLTGGLDGSTATTPGILLPLSNLGTIYTDGIDVSANYSTDIGFAKLALSFQGNWTNRSRFKATPTAIDRECVGFYSTSCGSIQPEYSFNQRTTLTFGQVDLSVLWRYIDAVEQEPDDILNGNGAVYSGPVPVRNNPQLGLTAGQFGNLNFGKIKAKHYFDFSGRVAVNDQLSLTLTVQNLLDKKPPFVGSGVGTTSYNSGNTYPSTYDTIGRRFAVAAKLRF